MTYKEAFAKSIEVLSTSWVMQTNMHWLGEDATKSAIDYLISEGIELTSITSSISGYIDGAGTLKAHGKCIYNEAEALVELKFTSEETVAQYKSRTGKKYAPGDIMKSYVELSEVNIEYVH